MENKRNKNLILITYMVIAILLIINFNQVLQFAGKL